MALTHYEVLGVPSTASTDEIRLAYRRRARETHPDAGGSAEQFAAVALAWEVLSAADARAGYDEGLLGPSGWGEDVAVDVPASWFPPSAGPKPTAPAPTVGPIDPFTSPPRPLPSLHVRLQGFPPYAWTPSGWLIAAVVVTLLVANVLVASSADPGGLSRPMGPGSSRALSLTALLTVSGVFRAWSASSSRHRWRASAVALWGSLMAIAGVGIARIGVHEQSTNAVSRVIGIGVTVAGLVFAVVIERMAERLRGQHWRRLAVLDRHRLSDAWNLLLRDREDVPAGRIAELRDVHADAPIGWVLIDDQRRVLASVPLGAPEAWVETLRAAGLDVLDVRRPSPDLDTSNRA